MEDLESRDVDLIAMTAMIEDDLEIEESILERVCYYLGRAA